MNILLSNDDGVNAKGLIVLYDFLTECKHNVYIVAPETEQSAKSHAITTRSPLILNKLEDNIFSVNGTPADCIIMAKEYIISEHFNNIKFDLVISGINAGQNLGDDVFYSGTVAAAIEGALYGFKSIAISSCGTDNNYFNTAAMVLIKLLDSGILDYINYREVLNINVPNIKYEKLKGVIFCQAGYRRYQNIVHKHKDHRNHDIFWLGGNQPIIENSDYEIDLHEIKNNKVTITPLKIDINDYSKLQELCESQKLNSWKFNEIL
jgi:5'-nucleotidase